jgi:hypothetical protein
MIPFAMYPIIARARLGTAIQTYSGVLLEM